MSKARLFSEVAEANEKIIQERINSYQNQITLLLAEVKNWQAKPAANEEARLKSLETLKTILDHVGIIERYLDEMKNMDPYSQEFIQKIHKGILREVEIPLTATSSENLIPRSRVYKSPEDIKKSVIDIITDALGQIRKTCETEHISISGSMFSKDHPLKTLLDAFIATNVAISAVTGNMVSSDYSKLQNKDYYKLEKNLKRSESRDLAAAASTVRKAIRELGNGTEEATIKKVIEVENKQIKSLNDLVMRDQGLIDRQKGRVDQDLEDLPPPPQNK